jgi:threonylcarbamoyladenosine tRNA methylthiotransferase MtaB
MKKVFVKTIGCRTNKADSYRLMTRLIEAGFQIVDREEEADVIIVNSCVVTSKSERDMRNSIYRAKRLSPSAKIILTGCYPQVYGGMNEVDLVLGIREREEIIDYMDKKGIFVSPVSELKEISSPYEWHQEGTRAFLKIQDGCDNFCSYCIVPFARGKPRSLSPELVLSALKKFSSLGYKEVVLTGIRLGAYGRDMEPKISLSDLIEMIESERPVERIRLSSVEPDDIDKKLIDVVKNSEIIAKHLHIPLQSPFDSVLKLMGRKYSFSDFAEIARNIKEKMENFCIGTDIIVGFPGEENQDFKKGYELLKSLPVDYFHIFSYSPRKGTKAYSMKSALKLQEVKKRVKILRELGEEKRRDFIKEQIGKMEKMLVEEIKDGFSCGLTGNYIKISVKGSLMKNEFYNVIITGLKDATAEGRLENKSP